MTRSTSHRLSAPALLLVLLASGCVAPQVSRPVPKLDTAPAYAVLPPPVPDEKRFNHMLQPLDDAKLVVYNNNFGGGGAAVGVLFGPLGVAANIKAIKNATTADVALLHGKLPVQPIALFQDVVQATPDLAPAAGGAPAVRLIPEVLVVKTKGELLRFGCTLWVDFTPVGTSWGRTYVFQTAFAAPKEQVAQGLAPEQLQQLEQELRAGYAALAAAYLDDLHGKAEPLRDVTFKSEYVTPRIVLDLLGKELPGPADRLVVRTARVTYSLPRTNVEVR